MSAADLSRALAEARRDMERVGQIACGEVSARSVARTPVDTGEARNSWEGSRDIDSIGLDDVYTFSSFLDYMPALEWGWSDQAPAGMIRITVAEWPSIVQAAAAQVRR